MYRIIGVLILVMALGSCQKTISPEDAALVESLRTEQMSVKSEIARAEGEAEKYTGGLIFNLLRVRLEILKTTDALISQRILALESGAPIKLETVGTELDVKRAAELQVQIGGTKKEIASAQAEADKYTGGLIQAMALSTVATHRQSLAMLEQAHLVAKFGLQSPTLSNQLAGETDRGKTATARSTPPVGGSEDLRDEIIIVKLLRKEYSEERYQEYVVFDVEFAGSGLDKPTRAVKGKINFQDLFGETKLSLGWTIDVPMKVGETVTEKGTGFEYNQFIDSHRWAKMTKVTDMKATYSVESIIYEDGTKRDVE